MITYRAFAKEPGYSRTYLKIYKTKEECKAGISFLRNWCMNGGKGAVVNVIKYVNGIAVKKVWECVND